MMDLISDFVTINAIAFAFAYLFVTEFWGYVISVLNFKPFNCVLCFTFWCSLLFYLYSGMNPAYAFFSGYIAEMLYRNLVNYGE